MDGLLAQLNVPLHGADHTDQRSQFLLAHLLMDASSGQILVHTVLLSRGKSGAQQAVGCSMTGLLQKCPVAGSPRAPYPSVTAPLVPRAGIAPAVDLHRGRPVFTSSPTRLSMPVSTPSG